MVDGKLVAAAEEERFRRVKHWAGFPKEAIAYCLREGGISLAEIDKIAINRNPNANLAKKFLYAALHQPSFHSVYGRILNSAKLKRIDLLTAAALGVDPKILKNKIVHVEHHRAHLASAFFVSGLEQAALVSVDGFGDFVSTQWGTGHHSQITVRDQVYYPHSLGILYLALTQFLGFPHYGDEYKVMGLAPYGKPVYLDQIRKLIHLKKNGLFELNLEYFTHHSKGVSMSWEDGQPEISPVFSDALEKLFGPARLPSEMIAPVHEDIAASLQAVYEEVFFHLLNYVQKKTGLKNLCLAGGCAMNSVANGKIYQKTPFEKIYVQSAAGDAGGAIGAAFYTSHQLEKTKPSFVMDHAYWGPEFSAEEIFQQLDIKRREIEKENCVIKKIDSQADLCRLAAQAIIEGKVVGWFQGRMEWGPRALGNRSILADPRRGDMKQILNSKIKHRESFRPFAPSILREEVKNWFETDDDVPFMLEVFQIKAEKRALVPAVTHVNGSGRLQTVSSSQNPLYHALITEFYKKTGVPMLLNTSFNENEPMVCRPEEALDCFLRTKMDVLVLGHFCLERF